MAKKRPRGGLAGAPAGNSRFVTVAAALCALGGLLFGYDTGVISGAILFVKEDFSLAPLAEEAVVSAVLLGALLGAAAGGRLSDRFGRRPVIILAAAVFTLGAIGTALAPVLGWLVAGRIVVGLAIGLASFSSPLYISEVSPPAIRGRLVSLNQLAITLGIVVSYLVGFALAASRGWRWMFALAAIPSAALAAGMIIMPESPRWLASRGRTEAATAVLRRIRGTREVRGELAEIKKSLGRQGGEWRELFAPLVKPALLIGIALAVFQQVTGINTIIYYAPTIFQSAGFRSASAAILATVGVGVVNVAFTVLALLLLDRVGRKPLLLIGLAGMIASLGILGLAFALPGFLASQGWFAVACLMLYVASFAVGLGPVFWLLISEIFPLKIRGLAMGAASVVNWGANLVIALTFLSLSLVLGQSGAFWLYGFISIGALFFTWFLVPETRGRTLEEIEAHWRAGRHPRLMGK
jgi:SP family galactose:H+ symporter-like MFS transporter